MATATVEGARPQMLVVRGGSCTGKTRTAYEAVTEAVPNDFDLLFPADAEGLLAVLAADAVGPRTVLWLNEAQEYLDGPSGEAVAAALLRRLDAAGSLIVIATLWPDHDHTLTRRPNPGAEDRHSNARKLLGQAYYTNVPDSFAEHLDAVREAARDDSSLAEAVKSGGAALTQVLVAGPDLMEQAAQAREYAAQGTLRLLMDGTTPKAAREQFLERQNELAQARAEIVEAEQEAKTLWQRAREADFRQALQDAQRQREQGRAEHERRLSESIGLFYSLTWEEIGVLDREDRDRMVRRQAIEASAIGYKSAPKTRIEMTAAEQRQLEWEELPKEVRAERLAEQERITRAQAEHLEQAQRQAAHRAPERSGPELGL